MDSQELLIGVIESFSDKTKNNILKKIEFSELITNKIPVNKILEAIANTDDKYKAAILNRVVAVKNVLESQKNDHPLDIKETWSFIFNSLIHLDDDAIVSSIGSQGFLSIPLFRLDKGKTSFDFLRLHIWSNSFGEFIDKDKVNNFAIHSHQFHTNSWILTGEVYNTIVDVRKVEYPTNHSLFKIEWNNTRNLVNQRTSVAINTGEFAMVRFQEKEIYNYRDSYEIEAGKYHISRTNSDHPIASTLFLFSTSKSRVSVSNVLGPSNINQSEINRKVIISPKPFLFQLNELIKT